jgi:hypothetical protein
MAQLRASRGQLSLRSYSAWCGVGPIVNVTLPRTRALTAVDLARTDLVLAANWLGNKRAEYNFADS